MGKQNQKKKNLTWKLKDLPTASELADLVDTGVVTPDEAREILFGSVENDKEKIKALEEQLDFLRDLVKELSKRNTTTITTWPWYREVRYYNSPYWLETKNTLSTAGYSLSTSGSGSTFVNTAGSVNSPAIGKLTTGAVGSSTKAFYAGSNTTDYSGGGGMTLSVSSNTKDAVT